MSFGICFAFAFLIIGGRVDRDRVDAWYPISDIRTLLAPSLRADVGDSLNGQISV